MPVARARISQGDVGSVARAARAELRQVAGEPGWCNPWTGEGYTPDYSHVRAHLESLLAAGQADLVLELGREVLELGTRQVEQSHDEGDTGCAISECLGPVWEALGQSSFAPAQRILWLVDRLLEDEYDLCSESDVAGVWDADPAAWSQAADTLLARLDEDDLDQRGDDREWYDDYRRNRLSDWAIEALDNAGREDDALALCLREAPITHSYDRAVERLMAAGRSDEARDLALEGISKTQTSLAGIASSLRDNLRQIASDEGDLALAAAFVADAFFQAPSLEGYRELSEVAGRAELWPQVRQLVLDALATGLTPTAEQGWPLPETGTAFTEEAFAHYAPWQELLTELALEEHDHDEALKWYEEVRADQSLRLPGISDRVAREVASSHPDEAVAIWDELAAEQIARGNRRAYEGALQYLRPMRDLLTRLGRRDEWETYLADLRSVHSRKCALLETLDRLAEGRIIDG